MEKKRVVRKKKTVKKHIVVFKDAQDNVLTTLFVADGESAKAPEMDEILEQRKHYSIVFSGWNQDISCVRSNLVVTPVYKKQPKEYLVMYFHENGKILGSETVIYGENAKAMFHPVKEENDEFKYHFIGWNCSLKKIDGDRMAKAMFVEERKRYPVRFFGADRALLDQQMVAYGASVSPPVEVLKKADMTYRYHFDRWSEDFSSIKKAMDIHAIFKEEYIDYLIRFYEENELILEKNYHYGDIIEYPLLKKTGYDMIWDSEIQNVMGTMDIHGRWQFANPKGKVIRREEGSYEITDPSITSGSVRLLEYSSKEVVVDLPQEVKLGDYYYRIESIHRNALASCPNMRKLICPNSLKRLEDECFAHNRKLSEVVIRGDHLTLGKNIFADCGHLRKISWKADTVKKIHREAFGKMNTRVEMKVNPARKTYYEKMFRSVILQKNMILVN